MAEKPAVLAKVPMKSISRRLCAPLIAALLLAPAALKAAPQGADALDYKAERVPWLKEEVRSLGLEPAPPGSLDEKNIPAAMRRLAYQKRGLSWSGKKSVFPAPLLERLAPLIARQWAQAEPGERVAFQISTRGGPALLQGDTFLTDAGMHWRLTVLNRKTRPLGDFNLASEPWRLVPLPGQRYHSRERYKTLKEEMTNWIILTALKPGAERTKDPRPAPAAPAPRPETHAPDGAAREKLQLLDELRRENLISGEDYERKRRQILGEP